MNSWAALVLLLTLFPFSSTAAVHHKKSVQTKSRSKAVSSKSKSTKTKSTRGKSSSQKARLARKSRDRKGTPAASNTPPRQLTPSNDRYIEIQQALAAKGYLATPPNGQWDQNSQDAMRRFQADQNLSSSGKLTARSITALGLGSSSPKP